MGVFRSLLETLRLTKGILVFTIHESDFKPGLVPKLMKTFNAADIPSDGLCTLCVFSLAGLNRTSMRLSKQCRSTARLTVRAGYPWRRTTVVLPLHEAWRGNGLGECRGTCPGILTVRERYAGGKRRQSCPTVVTCQIAARQPTHHRRYPPRAHIGTPHPVPCEPDSRGTLPAPAGSRPSSPRRPRHDAGANWQQRRDFRP